MRMHTYKTRRKRVQQQLLLHNTSGTGCRHCCLYQHIFCRYNIPCCQGQLRLVISFIAHPCLAKELAPAFRLALAAEIATASRLVYVSPSSLRRAWN